MESPPLDVADDERILVQPFSLAVTRVLEYWPEGTREKVIHEEVVLAHDLCELCLVAENLLRVYEGDGYLIRRLEDGFGE